MKRPEGYKMMSAGKWVLSENGQRIVDKLERKRKRIKAARKVQKKK